MPQKSNKYEIINVQHPYILINGMKSEQILVFIFIL